MKLTRYAFAAIILLMASSYAAAQTYEYTIKVQTGKRDGAGTGADVHITLYGDGKDGVNGVDFRLDTANNDDFRPGALDSFKVTTEKVIGRVHRMRLYHDNGGDNPGWYADWVEVFGPRTGEKPFGGSDAETKLDRKYDYYRFTVDRWLAKDEDDRRVEVFRHRDGWVEPAIAKITKDAGRYEDVFVRTYDIQLIIPGSKVTLEKTSTIKSGICIGSEVRNEVANTTTVGASATIEAKDPVSGSGASATLSLENSTEVRRAATESTTKSVDTEEVNKKADEFAGVDGMVGIIIIEEYMRQTEPGEITLGDKKIPFVKRSGSYKKNIPHFYKMKSKEYAEFLADLEKKHPELLNKGSIKQSLHSYLP